MPAPALLPWALLVTAFLAGALFLSFETLFFRFELLFFTSLSTTFAVMFALVLAGIAGRAVGAIFTGFYLITAVVLEASFRLLMFGYIVIGWYLILHWAGATVGSPNHRSKMLESGCTSKTGASFVRPRRAGTTSSRASLRRHTLREWQICTRASSSS